MTQDAHPSDDELRSFALGKLVAQRAATLEMHLEECHRCARAIALTPDDGFIQQVRASGSAGDEFPTGLLNHPRYRVLRPIGEGGMARVYLAEHRLLRSQIAIKTIRQEYAGDRSAIDRFLQEARTAGQLGHTNIARIFDAEEVGSLLLLAMEYVPGKTLAQVVAKKGPLPVAFACHYVRQIAYGLQHAMDRGVIHRDIKPQNIMLMPATGQIKILDFGLGRLVDTHRSRRGLTKDNEMLGTPHYVAPEQARDAKTADIRSDIYSLGGTFFYLLAGETLFNGSNVLDLLVQHESAAPRHIRSLRPDVPVEIDKLIGGMLAKDPKERPQTPQEIIATIAPFCPRPVTPVRVSSEKVPMQVAERLWHIARSPAFVMPLVTFLLCLLILLLR